MKRKTCNISILVLFHLLIFIAPCTTKALHYAEQPASVLSGITASKEDRCLICGFDYVSFKQTGGITIPNSHYIISIVVPVDNIRVFMPCLTYYKLRAPPQLQLF